MYEYKFHFKKGICHGCVGRKAKETAGAIQTLFNNNKKAEGR